MYCHEMHGLAGIIGTLLLLILVLILIFLGKKIRISIAIKEASKWALYLNCSFYRLPLKVICSFGEIQCMVHLCTLPNSSEFCLMLFSLSSSSSRAVGGVPTSLFYPVVTWVLLLVIIAYWAVVALYPTILYRSIMAILSLVPRPRGLGTRLGNTA